LRRTVEDYTAGTDFEAVVLSMGVVRELHPIARDEVYRIAYEAIRNAVAHSGATKLRIEIAYGGEFRLEIHDDGRGIDAQTLLRGRPSHYGLAGMRERAAGAGGKLAIVSSPEGTTVTLRIPGHAIYKQPYGLCAQLRDRLLMRHRPKWS
jgi:signal transduction histidine kinase